MHVRTPWASVSPDDPVHIDVSPTATAALLDGLPGAVRSRTLLSLSTSSPDEASREPRPRVQKALSAALAQAVGGPALRQAVKGLFTAGITTSAKYAAAKLRKQWVAAKAKRKARKDKRQQARAAAAAAAAATDRN